MKKIGRLLLIAPMFILLQPSQATAQCCAAGSPANINPDLRTLKTGGYTISASVKYSNSEAYFSKDNKLDITPLITRSDYLFGSFSAGYTILRGLEINASLGYFFKKAEHYKIAGLNSDDGYGLSDLSIGCRGLIYRGVASSQQLFGTVNVTFPTGQFDLVRDDVTLPVQLQPSSGAFKYRIGLQYIKSLTESKIDLFAQGEAELSARIKSKNFNYRYGNYYSLTLGAYRLLNNYITVGLQTRGEWRERSDRDDGIILEATGFRQVALCPLVAVKLLKKTSFSFIPQIPVYRYYNGIQMANSWSGTAAVTLNL
ncbi:MAG TPA: hypothetical protein DCR43_00490 [Bacteroidales bacterium]|nr:MAG: hypothetical protein A2X09_14335 [Bacteroidetes bacterium GWF2_43_11]HAQ64329.1 hypothetical protein [Bacteroidales bacterium]